MRRPTVGPLAGIAASATLLAASAHGLGIILVAVAGGIAAGCLARADSKKTSRSRDYHEHGTFVRSGSGPLTDGGAAFV